MRQIYELAACRIKVDLQPGIIRVYSDSELWRFLNGHVHERFNLLAQTIKNNYKNLFNEDLVISNDSLIVEILVHVYCDYVGLKFNSVIKLTPLNNFVKKLLLRAEIVDCGEKEKDSNRWVWDFLARFKPIFVKMLPKNLNNTNLKMY